MNVSAPLRRVTLALVTVIALVLLPGLTPAASAAETHDLSIDGTSVKNDRLFRDGVPSTCGAPKAFPGDYGVTSSYSYSTVEVYAEVTGCATVTVNTTDCPLAFHTALFTGAYNPANPGSTYLGDAGFSGPGAWSVNVTAGQQYTFLMENASSSGPCQGNVTFDGLSRSALRFTSTAPTEAVPGQTYGVTVDGAATGTPVVVTIDPTTTNVGTNRQACTISGATVTFRRVGTCVIAANQAAGAGLPAPATARQTIAVRTASAVRFTSTRTTAKVGSTYQPTAQTVGATSGAPIVFTIDPSTAASCSIAPVGPKNTPTVTFTAVGPCTIVAEVAGDGTYAPGRASQTVTVTAI